MSNKITRRIKQEIAMRETFKKGYPRITAGRWYYATQRDNRLWKNKYTPEQLKRIHSRGYLAKTVELVDLLNSPDCDRITDLDYLYLRPYNNSFSKWIEDINTMVRMHIPFQHRLPTIYYSIVNRNGLKILDFPFAKQQRTVDDIMNTLKEAGTTLRLRPAYWNSTGSQFDLLYVDDEHVKIDSKTCSKEYFLKLLKKRGGNYLICEKIHYGYPLTEDWKQCSFFKFYMVNDCEESRITCAVAEIFRKRAKDKSKQYLINRENGTFTMEDGTEITIPRWNQLVEELKEFAFAMRQLDYFTVSVVLTEDGFKVSRCNHEPYLPRVDFDSELNEYLKKRVAEKKATPVDRKASRKAIYNSLFNKFVGKFCRKGIRPYMQGLWFTSVLSDAKWKGSTWKQKIWAWKRGFLSFRIGQYNLTEENYKTHLSDYDYHWLNRMNNVYQGWISDKTTFRYTMEPLKKYIPDYYYSIFKRDGQVVTVPMQDIPEGYEGTLDDVVRLLHEEKILVFKPSAGLHGDGFYCLEHKDENFWINGNPTNAEGIKDLIRAQRSIYVVTSYINMHPTLKKIYPTSVNSIRVMAINRHGYDPQVMQTYMRIGSSKTGYTDNVGYGGICAMIDIPTGVLYDPETLVDHIYYPCPKHPDTGTEIAGIRVPHWATICEKVGEICQLFPELEYLGFDVAVTEDGFQIMEINLHQDLHKVALHTDEIRAYYQERIAYKKRLNNIK